MNTPFNRQWLALPGRLARHPRRAAIAATALVLLIGALIRPPVIEGSMVDQISGTNARLEISRRIQAATGGMTTTAVIVTPADVSIDTVFANLGRVRARLASLDSSTELRSIDAARDQLFLYGLSGSDPAQALLDVLQDNPEANAIISKDATRFLLVATFPERLEREVLNVLTGHDWAGVFTDRRMLSTAQLENDIAAALMKDLWMLIPVIVVAVLLALYIAFGRWRALALPVFASLASTLITFALFSVAGVTINLVTLLALPVVLIVGLANSCHFLAKAGVSMDASGDVTEAVVATLRRVGPPFFFSSLTTATALASLGLNEIPPIANFGRLSAAALMLVFIVVMLAAPLSLRWYLDGYRRSWQESRTIASMSRRLVTYRGRISVALVLLMLSGGATIPFLSMHSDPRAFFPDAAPFAASLKIFEREFHVFSPLRILIDVDSVDDDALLALRQAGGLRESLAEHADIRRVTMQPAISSDTAYVLVALLAHEGALDSVIEHIEQHRASLAATTSVIYSSASMVYEDIDRQAMGSLLQSLGWSLALIFGAILIISRSLHAVLSTMLANAVPLMLVCGVVWLIGNPLNLVTVFVFLVALGVIVDDAIHILFSRAAGETLAGSSIEFSVLLSTAILCLGLLLWQLSDFPTTREFAAYCALALVGAVVSNLTVLPSALRWPRRNADQS